MQENDSIRRAIRAQAVSIGLALAPFGLAFGALCAEAGISMWEALGFSALVFAGSSQFAAVSVLADDGTVIAAITAGLLLNLRSLAFGVSLAPSLKGSFIWRACISQLMIDESTAVASSQSSVENRRYGYLWGGISVFVLWNLMTLIGVSVLSETESIISDFGIDATIPAAFLGLIWGRLKDSTHRATATIGALIALILIPITPAGIPVIAAAGAIIWVRPWKLKKGADNE
ncbi:MAG: AzlC family ABC transporter permease [Acidimicrobiales bacterium]|jgi:predicted branched-subunit amino acid permease|nr:AzlC family ABC transporter permease [Acidimicrobiales bacterium]MDP6322719.1 AzlC family ABC transporter permease [Acidimicrobiales bacterium]HJM28712.1 AzlC family ABC transporter permease [Acidimicrobiales bacterium]HJM97325.1 AzlC family ABC transporter permease [Acidimicrobiales bacterium]